MVVLSDLSLQYFSNAEFSKIKVFVDLLNFELKSPLTLLLSPPRPEPGPRRPEPGPVEPKLSPRRPDPGPGGPEPGSVKTKPGPGRPQPGPGRPKPGFGGP